MLSVSDLRVYGMISICVRYRLLQGKVLSRFLLSVHSTVPGKTKVVTRHINLASPKTREPATNVVCSLPYLTTLPDRVHVEA